MRDLLDQGCAWLQNTPFSLTIETVPWIIPALQTIHILAIALVISSVFLLHLRLLGITGGEQLPSAVARRFLPFIWWPLPVLLVTGGLLISAEPARSLENPSFAIKMILLTFALAVTALYQRKLTANADYWEATAARRLAAKAIAGSSLLLWTGIVLAGRWIAYTQP
jgi:hypothetical protein